MAKMSELNNIKLYQVEYIKCMVSCGWWVEMGKG